MSPSLDVAATGCRLLRGYGVNLANGVRQLQPGIPQQAGEQRCRIFRQIVPRATGATIAVVELRPRRIRRRLQPCRPVLAPANMMGDKVHGAGEKCQRT